MKRIVCSLIVLLSLAGLVPLLWMPNDLAFLGLMWGGLMGTIVSFAIIIGWEIY